MTASGQVAGLLTKQTKAALASLLTSHCPQPGAEVEAPPLTPSAVQAHGLAGAAAGAPAHGHSPSQAMVALLASAMHLLACVTLAVSHRGA